MIASMIQDNQISFRADAAALEEITFELPEGMRSSSLILNSSDLVLLFKQVQKIGKPVNNGGYSQWRY